MAMPKIRGIKPETWTDDKFVELSAFARLLWIGMWNFACDNGHIEDKPRQLKMRILPTDSVDCAELLDEIVSQGLVSRSNGWITIPNLAHHQKPHKRWWITCEAEGCALPEGATYGFRKAPTTVEQPLNNGGSTADVDVDGDVDGDGDGDGDNYVSEVVVIPPLPVRPDVERICARLADRIEANGSKRPVITKAWLNSARLMLDRDGRSEQEISGAIDWCQGDEFWRGNVLSMPKLREKYDQLRLQAQRAAGNPASRLDGHRALVEKLAKETA